jgi:hypothetical protein
MSIKRVLFVFLLMNVISGRLKGIVLSVSRLRFQYSLKLSFSSTLDDVYFIIFIIIIIIIIQFSQIEANKRYRSFIVKFESISL